MSAAGRPKLAPQCAAEVTEDCPMERAWIPCRPCRWIVALAVGR